MIRKESQTEQDLAEVAEGAATMLQTVDARLATGADSAGFNGNALAPEKRAWIEDLIRKGHSLSSIADETRSSRSTVALVRDKLVAREPGAYKAHMASTLQRVANKAVALVEQGIDRLEGAELGTGQIVQLSVSAGILMDKLAGLSGDAVQVVEHRVKVDADAVRALVGARKEEKTVQADVIDVTPST